jgi:hypothetical protein
MSDYSELRIQQLENWIASVITRPSMSRDLRLQGLEIVESKSLDPSVREAVERICPRKTQGLERTLEIER